MSESGRTAEQWTAANSVLAKGELGIETDTTKIKVGDGVTPWRQLEYLVNQGPVYVAGQGMQIAADGTIDTLLTYTIE